MGKRRYRRKKASLEARVKEHREKIAQEQRKVAPIWMIRHWEREIAAFQAGIEQAQKRLRGMSTVKRRPKAPYLNPGTVTLLAELGEECQRV